MNNKKIIIVPALALIALSLVLAPTIASTNVNAQQDIKKPDKEPKDKEKNKKCQVKVQVKVLNAINGTTYVAQLEDLNAQSKIATEDSVSFVFQFKKASECPGKGDIVEGVINEEPFSATINYLTKPTKIGIDLVGDDEVSPTTNSTTQ